MPVLGGTTTLADGVVTLSKLGFDPATQAELDAETAALEAVDATLTTAVAAKADTSTVLAGLAGKLASGATAADSARVGGVAVTGTPAAGNVLTATGATAAGWSAPSGGASDATTSSKGVVQLAGDLAGTAASPTVPGLAAKADATATTAALAARVQIGGDLAGTATAPTVPGLASKADATGTTTALAGRADTALSNLSSAATARTNLGLGGSATRAVGTIAGTVAAGDDSRIVNAAADTAVVHTTGAETVAGVKTFTSSPVVPTPTTTTQAATKGYVDGVASSGSTPDADGTTKGKVQLAGDLGGTAASPTVPGLAGKASTSRQVIAGAGLTGGGDLTADRTLTVAYGTTSTTAARGDDSRITGAAQRAGATLTGAWDFTGATVTGIGGSTVTYPSGAAATVVPRPVLVDVRDYGTLGVSTSADTTLLANALTAAGAGGTVTLAGQALTVSGVNLVGRTIRDGTIQGAGVSVLVSMSGTKPVLERVRLVNPGGTSGVDVAASTVNPRLRDVDITGNTSRLNTAYNLNATGIVDPWLDDVRIDYVTYGVLTNFGAPDVTGVRVRRVKVTRCAGDAVEFNHPNSTSPTCSDFLVDDCDLAVSDGSGSTAGFGLGAAGVNGLRVVNTRFGGCRLQAVHLEDNCRQVSLTGGAMVGSPLGLYALDCDFLTVTGTTFDSQTTNAIKLDYDGTNWVSRFVIDAVTVRNAGGVGIYQYSDEAVNGRITNTIVQGCGSHGIQTTTSPTSYGIGGLDVTGNTLVGNGGYGWYGTHKSGQRIQGNRAAGNTSGAYGRDTGGTSPALLLVPIHDPSGEADATFTSNTTGYVDMFPVGSRATGNITVTATVAGNAADRSQQVWNFTWNGSSFTPTTVGGAINNGGVTSPAIRQSSGMLQVKFDHTGITDGTTVRLWALMQGVVLL